MHMYQTLPAYRVKQCYVLQYYPGYMYMYMYTLHKLRDVFHANNVNNTHPDTNCTPA